jgi:hypothetical protein
MRASHSPQALSSRNGIGSTKIALYVHRELSKTISGSAHFNRFVNDCKKRPALARIITSD